jgi:dihydroxyacetone kinase
MGQHFPDDAKTREDTDVLAAVTEAKDAIIRLGKAQLGDKTMVDALVPFVESLRQGLEQGDPLPQAWVSAATAATTAAEETAALRPKIGRARPLAERSVGTPDAGATSLALILVAVGHNLDGR